VVEVVLLFEDNPVVFVKEILCNSVLDDMPTLERFLDGRTSLSIEDDDSSIILVLLTGYCVGDVVDVDDDEGVVGKCVTVDGGGITGCRTGVAIVFVPLLGNATVGVDNVVGFGDGVDPTTMVGMSAFLSLNLESILLEKLPNLLELEDVDGVYWVATVLPSSICEGSMRCERHESNNTYNLR
jgi:hypothetical protein